MLPGRPCGWRRAQAWLELYTVAVYDQLPALHAEELAVLLSALARVGFSPR